MADILESGKEYWKIAKRFHTFREQNPMMRPIAIRDMQKLRSETKYPGVGSRIDQFIARNRREPQSGLATDTGPKTA